MVTEKRQIPISPIKRRLMKSNHPLYKKLLSEVDDPITLKVPFTGSFVYKQDIREICGIDTNYRWTQHINLCRKYIPDFASAYAAYQLTNAVPRILAREIILKAYEGQEVRVAFCLG